MLIAALGQYFFGITIFMSSIFLIMLVLVQRGRGGGLAGALGGPGGQSAFGTKAGDLFTKITIGVATVWIFLCASAVFFLKEKKFTPTTTTPPASMGAGVGGENPPIDDTVEPASTEGTNVPIVPGAADENAEEGGIPDLPGLDTVPAGEGSQPDTSPDTSNDTSDAEAPGSDAQVPPTETPSAEATGNDQ